MSARDDLVGELSASDYVTGDEVERLICAYRDQVLREAGDWIKQHDPADELSWFIEELREGLRNHPPGSCKDCYTAQQLAPNRSEEHL